MGGERLQFAQPRSGSGIPDCNETVSVSGGQEPIVARSCHGRNSDRADVELGQGFPRSCIENAGFSHAGAGDPVSRPGEGHRRSQDENPGPSRRAPRNVVQDKMGLRRHGERPAIGGVRQVLDIADAERPGIARRRGIGDSLDRIQFTPSTPVDRPSKVHQVQIALANRQSSGIGRPGERCPDFFVIIRVEKAS